MRSHRATIARVPGLTYALLTKCNVVWVRNLGLSSKHGHKDVGHVTYLGCVRFRKSKQNRHFTVLLLVTALFTKPPDGLPPYRTRSGGHSVWQFPIDIFPFCREWPVTKELVAL